MRTPTRGRTRSVFLFLAVIASAAPVSISPRGVVAAETQCQSGTCCEEPKSLCIIGSWALLHKYAKAEGSCAQVPPIAPD
jgi:hypothetical protein